MKKIKASDFMRILHKQNFRCAYTGVELKPDESSADHIIPVCKGGSHSPDNIAVVTKKVNSMKGTLSYDEFVELCGSVYFYAQNNKKAA